MHVETKPSMLAISFTRVSAPTLAHFKHVTNESFFDVVAVGKHNYFTPHNSKRATSMRTSLVSEA